jgi:hypothetical protein
MEAGKKSDRRYERRRLVHLAYLPLTCKFFWPGARSSPATKIAQAILSTSKLQLLLEDIKCQAISSCSKNQSHGTDAPVLKAIDRSVAETEDAG